METVETPAIRMDVTGKDADAFMDALYMDIKSAFLHEPCGITVEHLEALAEQLIELAARKKEEAGGKQEG